MNKSDIPRIELNKMYETCAELMQWAQGSKHKFNGFPYGSERLLINSDAMEELRALLEVKHLTRTGKLPIWTIEIIAILWMDIRKGNYKTLSNREPILKPTKDKRQLFLFPDIDKIEKTGPSHTIYAYIGHLPKLPRVIKIGYTSQDLDTYLKTKNIYHEPVLLSSKCGDKMEERALHATFVRQLVCGREWFSPVPQMLDEFTNQHHGWSPEKGIDEMFAKVLTEWEKYENQ